MSDGLPLRPYRPGLRAGPQLLLAELRSVGRDTAGLVVPLVMPALILAMYGLQSGDGAVSIDGEPAPDVSFVEAFALPVAIAMVLALVGVVNMPSFLAAYRQSGVLRRLGVTPLGPTPVLLAQVVTSAIQSAIGIGIALAVAMLAFDVSLPRSPWWALVVLVLGAWGMYGLGMIVAAVAPSANASVAIGLVTFFLIGAAGGMFGPTQQLPESVQRLGVLTPFGAVSEAMQAAWVGAQPDAQPLVALACAGLIGLVVAVRAFRWGG